MCRLSDSTDSVEMSSVVMAERAEREGRTVGEGVGMRVAVVDRIGRSSSMRSGSRE